jgi:hypothetical protein
MKLSSKATILIQNTLEQTEQLEKDGKHPFFTSSFWASVLKDPSQYKKLVKQVEKQATALGL